MPMYNLHTYKRMCYYAHTCMHRYVYIHIHIETTHIIITTKLDKIK